MFTYPIFPSKLEEKILITMTPTASYTVGFKLVFSGSMYIDFKDGAGIEVLTSGIEKTHIYVSASTYIAEITGDLDNITQFIADNNRITGITGLKTGLLTVFNISNNLYVGNLDLSNAAISGTFHIFANFGMTGITTASSGNGVVTSWLSYQTGLSGIIDLSNIPISTTFWSHICPDLETYTFASSGNGVVNDMRIYSGGLEYLDLSNIQVRSLQVRSNTNMTSLTLNSSNGLLNAIRAYLSDLGYIDFTGCSLAANNVLISIYSNNMTATEVNHILVDLYSLVSSEGVGGDYTGRSIDISGTNAAPDGTSGGYDGLTAKTNLQGKGFTVTTN